MGRRDGRGRVRALTGRSAQCSLVSQYFAFRGIERSRRSAPPVNAPGRAVARIWGGRGAARCERGRLRSGRGNGLSGALQARGRRPAHEQLDEGGRTSPPGLRLTARGRGELAQGAQRLEGLRACGRGGGDVIEPLARRARPRARRVGIRGRLRQRILAESEDHLLSDPEASIGSARPDVANAFAAELGARSRAGPQSERLCRARGRGSRLRRLASSARRSPDFRARTRGRSWPSSPLRPSIFAPQVSFVAGSLALRARPARREPVLPTAELTVINRRTWVALVFGLVTMGALAPRLRAPLRSSRLVGGIHARRSAVATRSLVLAAVPAAVATLLRPHVGAQSGDLFDDLGFGRTGSVALRPQGRVQTRPRCLRRRGPSSAVRSTVPVSGAAEAPRLSHWLRGVSSLSRPAALASPQSGSCSPRRRISPT